MKILSFVASLALVITVATAARAGTYLDTAALLLDGSHRSTEWVRTHLWDDTLATIAHELSEARVKSGRAMSVPHEVAKAHPHLLLSLEASERAMAAAAEGERRRFLQLVAQAREEERTFREILGQQKFAVPDVLKDTRARR